MEEIQASCKVFNVTDQFLSLLPLIARRARAVHRRCNMLSPEDLSQAAALRLWKSLPSWEPSGSSLGTWAFSVITNAMIDALRKHGRMFGDGRSKAWKRHTLRDHHRVSHRCTEGLDLSGLTQRSRLICLLRFNEGMGLREIGESIGMSESGVCKELQGAVEVLGAKGNL